MRFGGRNCLLIVGLAAMLWWVAAPCALSRGEDWSFEEDTGGWTALGCSISRVDRAAKDGSWCLAVSRRFPGTATITRPLLFDANKTSRVSYHVLAPKSAGPVVKTLLFLKNKDGLWYQCVRPWPLYPGAWCRVEFDLSPSSSQVVPFGHFRRWSNAAAAEMETVGIKFFSEHRFDGEVLVDDIRIEGEDRRQPLAITDFRPNKAQVPRFDKFELTFDLNRSFANPFDPELIAVDAEFTDPQGRKLAVPGFYHQDFVRVDRVTKLAKRRLLEGLVPVGPGRWKVRFAPDTVGRYSYVVRVVDRTGVVAKRLTTRPRRFTCVDSSRKGYVRVARDGRYFEFSTDQPFYPIGHNVHSPNDISPRNCQLLKMKPADDRGTKAYEDIFRKMAAHGENLAEVWMASWSLDIEWTGRWKNYFGLGRYNLHNAWKLDRILSIADQHGIYVHLVLENHGKLSTFVDQEWQNNPYSEDNGGFLAGCKDFFSRRDAWAQYKKKLRYIIARWGYSTRIMGLELWSEIDLTGDNWADHQRPDFLSDKIDWHREMTRYIRTIDHRRHLLTTHYSGTYNRVQAPVVQRSGIDYITLDAYRGKQGGNIVRLLERTATTLGHYGKPILVTEYGGSPMGTSQERMEADLHAGIWSAYMMNHAGSPLLWWFMYIDRKDKYHHYKALANFARGEDRRNRKLETARLTVSGPAKFANWASCLALRNNRAAYLWVYDTRSAQEIPDEEDEVELAGLSLSLRGFQPGAYTVEFWDTYKGAVVDRAPKIVERGEMTIRLPTFKFDIALKIKRAQK